LAYRLYGKSQESTEAGLCRFAKGAAFKRPSMLGEDGEPWIRLRIFSTNTLKTDEK
jgi:hypothetical protein